MEIFARECYGLEDDNAQFFFRWYEAIIRDFNIFKNILEKYEGSKDKESLLLMLSYIKTNLTRDYDEDDRLILKSTPNYFLLSVYDEVTEIPVYILISKDYKKFLITSEEMECFDDEAFDEEERYGVYLYNYYFLEDNKVKHYEISNKEYTKDYNGKFYNLTFYSEPETSEDYYTSLLDENIITKKLTNN